MIPDKFIAAGTEYSTLENHVAAPLFRKTFTLEGGFEDAEIFICGLGFYELFVNGTKITKGLLAPYISNPDDCLYYDRYDVAEYLKKGENCIGVMLGNGMLNAPGGEVWGFDKALFRSAPKLALTFSSEELVFQSDETFKTADSPITFDDLRVGEFYDARKEQVGWSTPEFADDDWQNAIWAQTPRGTVELCEAEPIVVSEAIKAVSITKSSDGFIYDFGVNAAGLCRLQIEGKPGREITLEHGEWLENGELHLDNIQFQPKGYRQKVKYICNGNDDYTPSFTYFGFRYVLVKGIDDGEAVEELLTYYVMNSDLNERGGFSCSDDTANRLQACVRRSTLANFYYFPTDCPQREKNGWTADAVLSMEHTLLNLQAEKSYAVWMDNIRKAQVSDGAVPGIVPTAGWGCGWGPGWDNVLVYLPYYVYLYRGDKKILEDNEGAIYRYLHYIIERLDERGLANYGAGDWCHAGIAEEFTHKAPVEVTCSIICMDYCQKAAFVFGVLSRDELKSFALELANKLRTAIRKYLVDFNTMSVSGNCQTSQAMGIFYDVFLPDEKACAFEVLLEYIKQQDNHMDVGVFGARVLFPVLSMFGKSDLAYEMITKPSFPSYGYLLTRDATSLFEAFQQDLRRVGSLNHHFFGDISGWFIKYVGGIRLNPYGENVSELHISPSFIGALSHAEAFHIAPDGKIETAWERVDGGIDLSVTVPEGMSGSIILPEGFEFEDGLCVKALCGGKYRVVSIGGKRA